MLLFWSVLSDCSWGGAFCACFVLSVLGDLPRCATYWCVLCPLPTIENSLYSLKGAELLTLKLKIGYVLHKTGLNVMSMQRWFPR